MDLSVLIRGGRLVDGSGNPWTYADVGIQGDQIACVAPIGQLPQESAREVVDATGMVVAPGFIDIQSHSIASFLTDGRSLSKITQGVTTEIMGELWTPTPFGGRRQQRFGWSEIPPDVLAEAERWVKFGDWLEFLGRRGVSVNVGSYLGGGTVREWACGWDPGDPTPDQLDLMRRVVEESMDEGAFGLATALIYPPNSYSPDHELEAMAEIVGRRGGSYITHLRSEGDRLLEALDDAIALGRRSKCPVEIYHLKATGSQNWSKMTHVFDAIDRARASGVEVAADMYPYVASGTGLTVLLPNWASEGGRLWETLEDPESRARVRAGMVGPEAEGLSTARNPRKDYVVPVGFRREENRRYIGLNLMEIAAERGEEWPDTVIELLLSERQRIGTVFFTMSEENLRLQLQQPWIKISTDAAGIDPAGQTTPVHPRTYGTYPRVLAKYVREERVLTLEDAVRKMTSSVAARLGLSHRGLIRPGHYADVILFDPETITDHATFTDSHQLSTGVQEMWVNGRRVLQNGQHTSALPGAVLRGPGSS